MTHLQGVWIKEQLIRIETVAGSIDVSDESRLRTRNPGWVIGLIRSPRPKAVIDRIPDRKRAREGLVGLDRHHFAQDRIGVHRRAVHPKLDTRGPRS